MKKHHCALFDLDGVVVDTAKYHYLAWKKIASEVGYELTHQDNEQLKGVSRPDSLKIILKMANSELSQEDFDRFLLQKNKDYLALIQSLNEKDILPGISEGLGFLKEKGVRIGLGSASKNAVLILEKLNLISFFEVVIDGNQVSKSKPDPEVFLKGSKALNVIPSECIVFEDATAGIEAAKKAGMTAIAFGDPSEFVAADFCFSDFDAIGKELLSKLF